MYSIFLNILFIFRGEGREKERGRSIDPLCLTRAWTGMETTTQARGRREMQPVTSHVTLQDNTQPTDAHWSGLLLYSNELNSSGPFHEGSVEDLRSTWLKKNVLSKSPEIFWEEVLLSWNVLITNFSVSILKSGTLKHCFILQNIPVPLS